MYRTAWTSYDRFCISVGVPSYPLSQLCLLFYAVSLSRRVCYATIKVYFAALQYRSNLFCYHTHLSQFHQLYYLLRGIRHTESASCRRPRRNPITLSHLRLLWQFLSSSSCSGYHRSMLFSACTLAFFGMLRSSEYTSPNNTTFLSNSTLQVTNISFSPDLSFVSILIKHSKTDSFRHGCTIRLAAVSSDLCPVAALLRYLRYRHYSVGPLFVFQSGIYLTRHHIVTLLHDALPHVSNINTHSFRIGRASTASLAGIPDSLIQVMGRWSSDAYHRYLRVSDATVHDVSVRMSNSSVLHRFWDSDTGSSKLLG